MRHTPRPLTRQQRPRPVTAHPHRPAAFIHHVITHMRRAITHTGQAIMYPRQTGTDLRQAMGRAAHAGARHVMTASSWRRWWLGPIGGLVVVVLAMASRSPQGRHWVIMTGVTHARDPWLVLLVRLPLSVFAPAQMLPCWFAVTQVTVVFGAAQIMLGWRRTMLVGILGHVAATVSARLWIALGPPLGVAHRYLAFPDAGPSVAVICLAAYVAVIRRMWWLAAGLLIYDIVETAVFNGLSQREHLVGVVVGLALGVSLDARKAAARRPDGHGLDTPEVAPITGAAAD